MPAIGFGTWKIRANADAAGAVSAAIAAGYRLIDTARIYGNEKGVGEAIRRSDLPRERLFVTTKLWNDDQGYARTLAACDASLTRLGLDCVDLYLIHWPATSRRHDSWRALETLLEQGKIRAAGVSNFTIEHLERLAAVSDLTPAVNQIEFHPFIYEQQRPLLAYCAARGIIIEAYSPLRRLRGAVPPVIQTISDAHHKSPQQVVLRWCLQHRTIPLPRSLTAAHIRANIDIFDFRLSDGEMRQLNGLSDGQRVTWDPADMGAKQVDQTCA